jgi:hypothetical protein
MVDFARFLAAAEVFRPVAAFFRARATVPLRLVLLLVFLAVSLLVRPAAFLAPVRDVLFPAARLFAAEDFWRFVVAERFRVEPADLRFAAVLAMVPDPRVFVRRHAAGERQAAAAVIDCRPVSDVSSNAYRNQREAILQPAGAEIPASTTEEDSV